MGNGCLLPPFTTFGCHGLETHTEAMREASAQTSQKWPMLKEPRASPLASQCQAQAPALWGKACWVVVATPPHIHIWSRVISPEPEPWGTYDALRSCEWDRGEL